VFFSLAGAGLLSATQENGGPLSAELGSFCELLICGSENLPSVRFRLVGPQGFRPPLPGVAQIFGMSKTETVGQRLTRGREIENWDAVSCSKIKRGEPANP
jgi:hypothetical protein